jgi:toxin ParE1/3/4
MAIAAYTLEMWGEDQAVLYLDGIEACCQRIAGNPSLGRKCGDIRRGLQRIEHGSHVVFYREAARGQVVVTRILHRRMLPVRHAIDDE